MTAVADRIPAISPKVRNLALFVQAAMQGRSCAVSSIDDSQVRFAIARHGVGPLLLASMGNDARVPALLLNYCRSNAMKIALLRATIGAIGSAFSAAGIPALLFKGLGLAQALYPDPTWREAGDIDIRVPAIVLPEAIAALESLGFVSKHSLDSLPLVLRSFAKSTVRDLTLVHARNRRAIELHSRLFAARRLSEQFGRLPSSLEPRATTDGKLAIPEIEPGYAHYLLLHGAFSGWSRLKWLADILPLFAKLTPEQLQNVADRAERTHTSAAIKASLLVLVAVFDDVELGPLDAWLREPTRADAIHRRARRYAGWLSAYAQEGSAHLHDRSLDAPNPLHNRQAALVSGLFLHDRFRDQASYVPFAVFSSGLRALGAVLGQDRHVEGATADAGD